MKCCRPGGLQKGYFNSALQNRVVTFDGASVIANPDNRSINQLANSHNGNYSGLAAFTLTVPTNGTDSNLVIDWTFVEPKDRIRSVRITTNYGNFLNDGDNIFNPTVQLFDAAGNPLTAPFVATAVNGGGFYVTAVPGAPVNNVSYLRMTNIRGNSPSGPATVGIREVELLADSIAPAALVYCPDAVTPLFWVDPRTGVTVDPANLTNNRR